VLTEREKKAIEIKESMQKHYLEDIRIQNELKKQNNSIGLKQKVLN
jgi:hypothetical protein